MRNLRPSFRGVSMKRGQKYESPLQSFIKNEGIQVKIEYRNETYRACTKNEERRSELGERVFHEAPRSS